MNAYNAEEYISESIQGVLNQTYDQWEIILWDNNSEDKTAQIVNSYEDKRIRYFLSDTFAGLGKARNLAIEKSNGKFIAFLDCDDLWLPTKLEKQIPLFQDPEVGLVFSDTIFFNKEGSEKQSYAKKKPPRGYVFSQLFSEYFISLETAIVRKEALYSLDHLFDERFQVVEEFDLFVRLSLSWKLDYVDEVLAKWRVHESSWTWSREELFPKEKRIMLEKYKASINHFEQEYKEEIVFFERSCTLDEVLLLWEGGKKKEARARLRPYLSYGPKWILLYFLIFFSKKLYNFLQKVRGNVTPQ
jgi:glycosyltransferase involved in cell wall biosynthesis